jgi:hypothetical protein
MTSGIHPIWTTYGTWLPGDRRGHWSPLFDIYGRVVEQGGRLQLPDEVTRRAASTSLREPPFRLDEIDAALVASEVSNHVNDGAPYCDRPVAIAAAIEPTHIHLLLGPVREDLRTLVGRLKGKSSSAVLASGRHDNRRHVWTEGYWKVFLFDALGIEAVTDYILDRHRRTGRGINPYPWCRPDLM